ncbi:MFS transporter [Paenibacillus doosanensis]|uniref:MFS transporter n=1 Tax=Paenibacillus doosanensis TaxID=1229154 RepID=UPI00218026DE|nr:MFS transporter [Paenibacillus doosanensis]MCS7463281.1 MFS transporter [Paenibacillus doosanensis]
MLNSHIPNDRTTAPANRSREAEGRLRVRIIAWITAISLLGDSMLYIVLPVYWQSFGLDALWQVGVLLSVNRFVRLPLNPLVGWLYGRMSKRSGVLAAAVLAFLTTAAYGALSGFAALLAARALWGAAWSLLRIGGYLTVLEAADDSNRGRLLGSYNGIIGVGSLVGMLAGGVLADTLGAGAVSLLLAAVMLAGVPLAWRYVPATADSRAGAAAAAESAGSPSAAKPALPRRPAALAPTPQAALVLASGLLTAVVFFGIYLGTMSRMIEAHMPAPGTLLVLGATLGAASLTGIVQAVRWAWSPLLSPRIGAWSDGPRGRLPVYLGSLALAAAALALLPLPLPFAAWLAVLMAAQLASTAITTLGDALAADAAAGAARVAFMTTFTTVVDVGAALGPLVGFALIGSLGLDGLYYACAGLLLLLIAAWAVHRSLRSRSPA